MIRIKTYTTLLAFSVTAVPSFGLSSIDKQTLLDTARERCVTEAKQRYGTIDSGVEVVRPSRVPKFNRGLRGVVVALKVRVKGGRLEAKTCIAKTDGSIRFTKAPV